jgi:hypothetical protein
VALFIAYTTSLPFLNQSRSTPLKPSFFATLFFFSLHLFFLCKRNLQENPQLILKRKKKLLEEKEEMLVLIHFWWAGGAVVVGSMIFALAVWRCFCFKDRRGTVDPLRTNGTSSLQDGIAKLHQGSIHHQPGQYETKRRGNYYVFRRGVSTRPLFNWADHPALITDAVENGWSRFCFTSYMPSPSTRSSMLGLCAAGDPGRETDTEISWEVCQGSADFMQKIRLNSGLKKVNVSNPSLSAASVIRTALPLPGPPLGNSSFPQEAYFEITVLYSHGDDQESAGKAKEGERAKLIQEKPNAKANSESLVHVSSSRISKIEELKLAGKDDCQGSAVMLSVGLTIGGSLPLKLPGSYPGSIGFNSNGSLYLDGKLILLLFF